MKVWGTPQISKNFYFNVVVQHHKDNNLFLNMSNYFQFFLENIYNGVVYCYNLAKTVCTCAVYFCKVAKMVCSSVAMFRKYTKIIYISVMCFCKIAKIIYNSVASLR